MCFSFGPARVWQVQSLNASGSSVVYDPQRSQFVSTSLNVKKPKTVYFHEIHENEDFSQFFLTTLVQSDFGLKKYSQRARVEAPSTSSWQVAWSKGCPGTHMELCLGKVDLTSFSMCVVVNLQLRCISAVCWQSPNSHSVCSLNTFQVLSTSSLSVFDNSATSVPHWPHPWPKLLFLYKRSSALNPVLVPTCVLQLVKNTWLRKTMSSPLLAKPGRRIPLDDPRQWFMRKLNKKMRSPFQLWHSGIRRPVYYTSAHYLK